MPAKKKPAKKVKKLSILDAYPEPTPVRPTPPLEVHRRPGRGWRFYVILFALAFIVGMILALAARGQVGEPIGTMTPGGAVSPDGKVQVACDLPPALRLKNTGGMGRRGPGTGAGLCVFTSTEHCGRWQNIRSLNGFQKSMMSEPGGGYPEKVTAMLKKYAPDVVSNCLQHTGGDVNWLKAALATSRMVGGTYCGHDPRYSETIAHMVNYLYLDDTWGCILDNNYPGEYLWMPAQDLIDRWLGKTKDGKNFMIPDDRGRLVPIGGGWALAFVNPPPPPTPRVSN